MQESDIGNPSGIRFEKGSKNCEACGTKEDIIQFEREAIRKGLSVIEIVFICKPCAKKEKLIRD